MNKKGFVRTIEAIIAILIVLIFVFTIIPKEKSDNEIPGNIKLVQDRVLNKIIVDNTLKKNVMEYYIPPSNDRTYTIDQLELMTQRVNLNTFIIQSLVDMPMISFNFTVCRSNNADCSPDVIDTSKLNYLKLPSEQIYAKSVMVANSTDQRIFRLFLWETI